ncbi:YceI family protein [bacterium]|nr:YceI family protein [bacterium]
MYTIRWIIFSLLTISLQAQTTWIIDGSHSNVGFTVTHLVVSETSGRFNKFEGQVTAQKEDFSDAQVTIKIQVKSIDTNNERRDKHLVSEDFFFADQYPEITFISKSFQKIKDGEYLINGDLTMRGVTKPIELKARYKGQVKMGNNRIKAGWTAAGSLNRFDYGLKWNELMETGSMMVGETVQLQFNIELVTTTS